LITLNVKALAGFVFKRQRVPGATFQETNASDWAPPLNFHTLFTICQKIVKFEILIKYFNKYTYLDYLI